MDSKLKRLNFVKCILCIAKNNEKKALNNDKKGYLKLSLGFTMAEILLSLTIIGVVAAITLPSLTGNINERTWNTQRKALYARISQAIALMPALNGYGQYEGSYSKADDGTESVTVTKDTAAMTFVTEGLSKVLKINNICDADHLQDCGISSNITTIGGSNLTFPKKLSELNPLFISTYSETSDGTTSYFSAPQKNIDTSAAAFETQNGESIAVFYNPFCKEDTYIHTANSQWQQVQPFMCANFIYDLNGVKGPNTVGKDVGFITAMYPSSGIVLAPLPANTDVGGESTTYSVNDALVVCKQQDEGNRLPNKDELTSMFYNIRLLDQSSVAPKGAYFSSTKKNNALFTIQMKSGRIALYGASVHVRCIKR